MRGWASLAECIQSLQSENEPLLSPFPASSEDERPFEEADSVH